MFPFSLIIRDKYDNTQKISQIDIPVLVLGASNDKVVPIKRAEELFKYIKEPKKMIVYNGAQHSNLDYYKNWLDILSWLKENEKDK